MNFNSNIDKNSFNKFIKSHSNISFMQTSYWGEFSKKISNKDYYLVGLEDNKGNIKCAGMLLKKNLILGYTYFYSPRGFIINYKDTDLLKEFTTKLKEFARNKKALFIKIDPEVRLHDLDNDGNILGNDNSNIVKTLKHLGYKHMGFNKNFENSEPRYTFRLDLSEDIDNIIENFHPTTKKIIKKGNPYNLEILKNDDANIEDFYFTMKETEKRENILYHKIDYYKEYYNSLHNEDMADLYEIKIDFNKVIKQNEDRKKDITDKMTILANDKNTNPEKTKNKLKEYNNQLTKVLKDLDELNSVKDKNPCLSSILTTKYGDTVWTVHGGNASYLRELNSNYLIYFEIIKDAKKEGYKYIDFFGTTGDPKEDNPVFGIHSFKKRLGGEYIEYIGEFDLITNKILYYIFKILIPIYRKIKRNNLKRER